MKPLLLIGPICKDINKYKDKEYHEIGGAVYYQSKILEKLKIPYQLETTISQKDKNLIKKIIPKEKTHTIFKKETLEFKNIYTNTKRIQYSNFTNNPIKIEDLKLNQKYSAIILNPLLKTDIPKETIKKLKNLKIPIFLSMQGVIRNKTKNNKIKLEYNTQIPKILKYTDTIFLDKTEAKIITKKDNLKDAINTLKKTNQKEIIITLSNKGSIIYNKKLDETILISPQKIKEAKYPTGAGDTYMITYIIKRLESENIKKYGEYASKITSYKIEGKY